ncbi:MAG TPA: hypothetical protein VFV01_06575 [Spirillospora sp.]|nr:hypothetical protein [Spirillospora sp.]
MGFSGILAFLQSPRPAETLSALGPWAALGMDSWHCVDDWQGVQFRHDQYLDWQRVLLEVMHETARPVVGAFVLDSDGACVLGAAPTSGNWRAVLEIEGVLAHLVLPEIEWVDGEETPRTLEDDPGYLRERDVVRSTLTAMCGPVEDIARRATQWADEAGYHAKAELIAQALETTGGFVEDVFMKLVGALGLPDTATDGR